MLRLKNGDFINVYDKNTIHIFDSTTGLLKFNISINYTVDNIATLRNDYLLVSGSNKVEIWDAYTGKLVHNFDDLNKVNSLLVLQNDKLAIDNGEQVRIEEIGKLALETNLNMLVNDF